MMAQIGVNQPNEVSKYPVWLEMFVLLAVRSVLLPIRYTPVWFYRRLAPILGWLLCFFFSGHFNVRRNLQIAFGKTLDPRTCARLIRAYWTHFVLFVFETTQLARLSVENVGRVVDCSAYEAVIKTYMEQGRGVLSISGHIGSYEYGPYAIALKGYPVRVIHNPVSMLKLYRYLKALREASGMRVFSRHDNPWSFRNMLKAGEIVVLAADLNAGRRGPFLPFFGVQASTYVAAASLAQAAKVPIVVVTTPRENGKLRMHVWKVIEYDKGSSFESRIQEVTAQINQSLEEAIRAYPEQWFWHYRRWRSRPKDEQVDADGFPPRVAEPVLPL